MMDDSNPRVDYLLETESRELIAYEYNRYIGTIGPMMRTSLHSHLNALIVDVVDLIAEYAMMTLYEYYREVWWNPIRNDGFRDVFTDCRFTLRIGDFNDASSSVQLELWISSQFSKLRRKPQPQPRSHHIGMEVPVGVPDEMWRMLKPLPTHYVTDNISSYLIRGPFNERMGELLMEAFGAKANHLLKILAAELGY
jgi:hypothetical protein